MTPRARLWLGHVVLTGGALLVVGGLYAATHPDHRVPNLEVLPEMVHPVPYESFSPNPVFEDGRTLQAPPDGTVARGALDDAPPFADTDAAALERGRVVFLRSCAPCHGPDGAGNGPVVRHGYPAPPSLSTDGVRAMTEDEIARIVAGGRGNMPSLAEQAPRRDRAAVARYVRSIVAAVAAAETEAAR